MSDPTKASPAGAHGAMPEDPAYRFVLLLDHDNIPPDRFNLGSIVEQWIEELGVADALPSVMEMVVRTYGGWFEEEISSAKRYEAHAFYEIQCPALIRIDGRYIRIGFSFADDLLISKRTFAEPGNVRITHTVSSRTSKKDFVLSKNAPSCLDHNCQLREVQRWLRSDRGCLRKGCALAFADTFVRKEQKQVDMHIAADLVALAMGALNRPHELLFIGIASDDLDFIPAIAMAMQIKHPSNRVSAIRFDSKTSYLDRQLMSSGASITNIQ